MQLRARWARVVVVALGYLGAGQLANLLALPPGYATAMWPSAGIALVATLRWGWIGALGTGLGSFALNAMIGTIEIGALIALGAAAQALAGAWLVRRSRADYEALDDGHSVARYFLLAGPIASLVGATSGTAVLRISDAIAADEVLFSWFTWWIGDSIGVLVMAPILLCWVGQPEALWRGRRWTVAIPMLVTGAAVVVAFLFAHALQADRAHAELVGRTRVIAHALDQRVARYADVAAAAASFAAGSPDLTREQFATFASGVFGRDRELVALGWAPRVTAEERAAFEERGRRLEPSFAIRIMSPTGLVPAPPLREMFPVLYAEPYRPETLGVDLASEGSRARAIERARANGTTEATRPVLLLVGERGLLFVAAARRGAEVVGVAAAGVASRALLASATEGLATDDLWITVVDTTTGVAQPLDASPLEATEWVTTLPLAGRTWRLGVAQIVRPPPSWPVWFVLVAGLGFSAGLGGTLLTLTGGRARLALAEARYRDLYENAPDMYFTIEVASSGYRVLDCNTTAADALGVSCEELTDIRFLDLVEPASHAVVEQAIQTLRARGDVAVPHIMLNRSDAGLIDASMTATAAYEGGRVVAARALLRDARVLAEAERDHRFQVELGDALHSSESIHAVMSRAAARISDYLDVETCHYVELDSAANKALVHQYTRGKREDFQPVTVDNFDQAGLGDLVRGQRMVVDDISTDARLAHLYEASYKPLGMRAFIAIPLMRGGVCVAYFGVVTGARREWTPREISLVQSVAERTWLWSEHLRSVHNLRELSRYLEERVDERTRDLVAAIAEREALVKEIHHRVKNNLQVISSMLRLQSRRLADPELAAVFEDSQQRIHAIALVHERLYQERDLSDVGLDDYLESLVDNLMYSLDASGRSIRAIVDVDGIRLPIERAIPCGMIVNELITNALKHAFPSRGGTVTVSMHRRGEQVELVVADDGVGLPPGMDPKATDSLGLDLVTAFAQQLDATLDIRTDPGTSFTLRFAAA